MCIANALNLAIFVFLVFPYKVGTRLDQKCGYEIHKITKFRVAS